MARMAQLLGLEPRAGKRVGEAAARDAALAHLRADGTEALAEVSGALMWDASGRAVWRFRWSGPLPGAPDLVVDVDAASGAVVWAGVPPR
jgi:hypothetical protein